MSPLTTIATLLLFQSPTFSQFNLILCLPTSLFSYNNCFKWILWMHLLFNWPQRRSHPPPNLVNVSISCKISLFYTWVSPNTSKSQLSSLSHNFFIITIHPALFPPICQHVRIFLGSGVVETNWMVPCIWFSQSLLLLFPFHHFA